jgi:hypothetical protein
MKIKKKADVPYFLTYFSYFAESEVDKLYFTFPWEHNGTITIMKYLDGTYSIHRKNDLMWDLHEVIFTEKEIENVIWAKRRFINPVIKVVTALNDCVQR